MIKRLLTVEFDKDEIIQALKQEFGGEFSDSNINLEESWLTYDPDTCVLVVHYTVGSTPF